MLAFALIVLVFSLANGYHGPEHHPVITKYGVPEETPEVRAAKHHHQIAHEIAKGHFYHGVPYKKYVGPEHHPVITKSGVPEDTPEVKDAKIHHEIAHQVASSRSFNQESYEIIHKPSYPIIYGKKYVGPEHYPIITKSGVPEDTPEVRDAKFHHKIAHEVALHQHAQQHNDLEFHDDSSYQKVDNGGYQYQIHHPVPKYH